MTNSPPARKPAAAPVDEQSVSQAQRLFPAPPRRRLRRLLPFAVTASALLVAAWLGWLAWSAYMTTPWTRDGRVRAYVVTVSPEISGRIVELPVRDTQFVHKGDLLMKIDPTDFRIAVDLQKAVVEQTKADFENKRIQAQRRQQLTTLSTSIEEKQSFAASQATAEGAYHAAQATLARAEYDLQRTEIRSPVNGWVTNLLTQAGNYAVTGQRALSVVDADSFWVDGYFEETTMAPIREGDPAQIKLMGFDPVLTGHVEGVARGINVANASPDGAGLASVNPIFTWIRLAQRVPVRIHIDHVPEGVRLVAGMTATVQIDSPRR